MIHLNKAVRIDSFDKLQQKHIRIEDIARNLSLQTRFCGTTGIFYSVAEHSVIVSKFCGKDARRASLLHDAHEAYIGDIIRPVAMELNISHALQDLKLLIDGTIFRKFNCTYEEKFLKEVQEVDDFVLCAERLHFFSSFKASEIPCYSIVESRVQECKEMINCLSPKEAEKLFLERYNDVFNKDVSVV